LFLPALLGLLSRTAGRAPIASRVGAVLVLLGLPSFMGIRLGQALELQGPRDGLTAARTGHLLDHLGENAIGAPIVAMFLAGTVLGLIAVAVAVWRAGLPRPAAVLIGVFGVADLVLEGVVPGWLVHAVLLVGLSWVAITLVRERTPRPVAVST
jgi:hypothetical protein